MGSLPPTRRQEFPPQTSRVGGGSAEMARPGGQQQQQIQEQQMKLQRMQQEARARPMRPASGRARRIPTGTCRMGALLDMAHAVLPPGDKRLVGTVRWQVRFSVLTTVKLRRAET